MTPARLRLDAVTVRYPGAPAPAVAELDLDVAAGETVALLGPSGCGKSTALRAVAGLEPLAAGRILVDGADLARTPVHRRDVGLLFQSGALFSHRDVAGNVRYGLERHGLPRAQANRRVGELLELVGLAGFDRRRVDQLSGGQAQRVALARALAPTPRVLLLDEPLAGLDRGLRDRLLEDIRAILTGARTTALFVTHDPAEAFAVADRVALLDQGRLVQVGAPAEVWARPVGEWAARFVGFRWVLDPAEWAALGGPPIPGLAAGERLAVRPAAFTLDPAGSIAGRRLGTVPTPDAVLLAVQVPALGRVLVRTADGPPGEAEGDEVRLGFDPAGAAVVPAEPVPG